MLCTYPVSLCTCKLENTRKMCVKEDEGADGRAGECTRGMLLELMFCRLRAFQYLAGKLIKTPFLSVYLPEDEVGLRTYLQQQCGEWTS